ncbi:MAG: hypothetical protein IAB99_05915 [Bacteroidetes bacterium]|uniref:Uncharacterized protein n=1 Tax=Candidatus Cryptobacteroides faecipullorum TaxID=2840764 RepID=A0A9D9I7R5_9BACT|nr:hypothetical protein [Candidatus Cryptobacteroides faecipullorum]
MKKCLILIACGILAAGCIRSPKNTDVKGTVLDASMNTVMILTEKNDTLSFSTLNADRTGLNGLLIGDTVEISYAGKYAPGMSAVKISDDKK